jgi:leader peptidase (prepilin peptidase) / N-methyltransferase
MDQIANYAVGGVFFLFGLIIGSFLNVVIYRLPLEQSIAFPGSHCPACNAPVQPYDNIPVVSYMILGGKCRSCGVRISPIYPAVELLVALLYLGCYVKDGLSMMVVADLVFVSLIVPLVFIDLKHKLLLNVITYPGLVVLLVLRLLAPEPWVLAHTPRFGLPNSPVWPVALIGSLLGAVIGGGVLWVIREAYLRIRGEEGMGLGDVKMMAMVGAFLGWQLTLLTIFIGSLLGSLVGVSVILMQRGTMKMKIPFGVFLGPGGVISMFVGPRLINWYAGFYE